MPKINIRNEYLERAKQGRFLLTNSGPWNDPRGRESPSLLNTSIAVPPPLQQRMFHRCPVTHVCLKITSAVSQAIGLVFPSWTIVDKVANLIQVNTCRRRYGACALRMRKLWADRGVLCTRKKWGYENDEINTDGVRNSAVTGQYSLCNVCYVCIKTTNS